MVHQSSTGCSNLTNHVKKLDMPRRLLMLTVKTILPLTVTRRGGDWAGWEQLLESNVTCIDQ